MSQEESYLYFNKIFAVIENVGAECYDVLTWRRFIDSLKQRLEGILLDNSNPYASVPIADCLFKIINIQSN